MSLDSAARGRGLGVRVLSMGAQWLWANTSGSLIEAYVRRGNSSSLTVFSRAGYAEQPSDDEKFVRMTLPRPREPVATERRP